MRQEAYVWQRVWTDAVKDSVVENRENFSGYTVQVADYSWSKTGYWKADYFPDAIDYAASNKVTIAVRIGAEAANSVNGNWQPDQTAQMTKLLCDLLNNLPNCDTIQIDYDCPSAKLAHYSIFLEALRTTLPKHQIEFTALPDWIRQDDFEALSKLADRYVIQVHGVSGYSKEKLCDPTQAKWAAEECGKLSTPFLIALPTYQHLVARNSDGKIIEVISEGSVTNAKLDYEFVSADKNDLTNLINLWKTDRPALMQGVIWYRLPVENEEMNWTIETLNTVMLGDKLPAGAISSKAILKDNGMQEIVLINNSTQRLYWPKKVWLSWEDDFCIAGEAGENYTLKKLIRAGAEAGMELEWKRQAPYMVAPKSTIRIGWLRLDKKSDISIDLKD